MRDDSEFKTVLEYTPEAVLLILPDGAFVYANEAACALFGYTLNEFQAIECRVIFDLGDDWLVAAQDVLRETGRVEKVFKMVRKNGTRFSGDVSAAAFTNSRNEQRTVLLVRDVTEREHRERTLRVENEEFRRLVELAPDAMVIVDKGGRIVLINQQAEYMFGFEHHELVGQAVEILVPDRFQRSHVNHRNGFQHDPHPRGMGVGLELYARRKDGSEFPVEISLSPIGTDEDSLVASAIRDVSDRKAADAARALLAAVVESSEDAILTKTLDSVITNWNAAAQRMFGYSAGEAIGQEMTMLVPESARKEEALLMGRLLQGERIDSYETQRMRKDGTLLYVSLTLSPIRSASRAIVGVSTIARDITAQKIEQDQIEASLKEKEALLREVHHRVKNNLQTVSSLLHLQAERVRDDKAASVLRESESRVQAMALIHQTLYQSGNLAAVDFAEYLRKLTAHVMRSFGTDAHRIRTEFDIASVGLTLDSAIPCGLITQELVSNSLKHAFPDGTKGTIRIGLHRVDGNDLTLSVADDGIGMKSRFDFNTLQSLGLRLVRALARQLKADLTIDDVPHGTSISLRFPEE